MEALGWLGWVVAILAVQAVGLYVILWLSR